MSHGPNRNRQRRALKWFRANEQAIQALKARAAEVKFDLKPITRFNFASEEARLRKHAPRY